MLVTRGAVNGNKIFQGAASFICLLTPTRQHRPSLSMTLLSDSDMRIAPLVALITFHQSHIEQFQKFILWLLGYLKGQMILLSLLFIRNGRKSFGLANFSWGLWELCVHGGNRSMRALPKASHVLSMVHFSSAKILQFKSGWLARRYSMTLVSVVSNIVL